MLLRCLLKLLVSGVSPSWGSPHLSAVPFLVLCEGLNGCTVKPVRELTWLKTDSDKESYMWGDAEGSWGTAQSHLPTPPPPRKEIPSRMDAEFGPFGYSPVWRANLYSPIIKTCSGSLLAQLLGLLFSLLCCTKRD